MYFFAKVFLQKKKIEVMG